MARTPPRAPAAVLASPAAKVVLASTVALAAGCAFVIVHRYAGLGVGPAAIFCSLTVLVTASWIWPIVTYSESSSHAHHLDEGFFVVLVLVAPPLGTLAAFLIATLAGQIVRRRPPVKTLFNLAQIVVSTSAGIAVVHGLAPPHARLGTGSLAAAALGAGAYFVVNSLLLAAILTAVGTERPRAALLDGMGIRSLLLGAAVAMGLVAALALSAYPYAGGLVMLPFLALRQNLAGHFRARHDRERLHGLFDATLKVQSAIGTGEVASTLTDVTGRLLRSPQVAIVPERPAGGDLAAKLGIQGADRWLTVRGRSPAEPVDSADAVLLEAIAAVGGGALATSALYEEQERDRDRLLAITSSLAEGVCAFDTDLHVTFMNPAAEQMLGSTLVELNDRRLSPFELAAVSRIVRLSIAEGAVVRGEQTTFYRRGGETFPVETTCAPILSAGQVAGAVLTFRDVSQRVLLEYHAFHDLLTGLPNRRIFLDRLQHALRRAERTGEIHAVLFVDVDRFKLTNDSLGHQTGDELLVSMAERLRRVVREGDTLARFGGDEFTLLLENIGTGEPAEAAAQRVIETVNAPVTLGGSRTVTASVSVGIALASAGASTDDVLHHADVAMYQAKRRGGGTFERFDPSATASRGASWLELDAGLRRAVEQRELIVHYQPIVSTTTGSVAGAEALVRWDHPEFGLVPPAQFLGVAEESGLILEIGRQVLEEACGWTRHLLDVYGDRPFVVAVNFSARQFERAEQAEEIRSVLEATGLEPGHLCVEITESFAMSDVGGASRTLAELKNIGVHRAIDDFGTGHSSLNHLKTLPVDVVKIDGGLVQGLETESVDGAVISAMVELARAAGVTVVAEGVETAGQLTRLAALGCPFAQGYYLAQPMSATDLGSFLRGQQTGGGAGDVLAPTS